jgi:hypothetical protein
MGLDILGNREYDSEEEYRKVGADLWTQTCMKDYGNGDLVDERRRGSRERNLYNRIVPVF